LQGHLNDPEVQKTFKEIRRKSFISSQLENRNKTFEPPVEENTEQEEERRQQRKKGGPRGRKDS